MQPPPVPTLVSRFDMGRWDPRQHDQGECYLVQSSTMKKEHADVAILEDASRDFFMRMTMTMMMLALVFFAFFRAGEYREFDRCQRCQCCRLRICAVGDAQVVVVVCMCSSKFMLLGVSSTSVTHVLCPTITPAGAERNERDVQAQHVQGAGVDVGYVRDSVHHPHDHDASCGRLQTAELGVEVGVGTDRLVGGTSMKTFGSRSCPSQTHSRTPKLGLKLQLPFGKNGIRMLLPSVRFPFSAVGRRALDVIDG